MGRIASRADALLRNETVEYDLNGNAIRAVDRNGHVTTMTYDGLDRLRLRTYDDGSTTTYTYDAGDRLTSIVESTGTFITRTYDGLDRVFSETTQDGTVSYTYDLAGRRATMTVNGGSPVTYGYDVADRLTSVTRGTQTVTLDYDAASRRTVMVLPGGIRQEYTLDDAGQTTGIAYISGGFTLGTLTYGYDAAGRRTTVGGTWARTLLPQSLAAAYDAASRLASVGTILYSYDRNGNVASDGPSAYAWNARNQLTAVSSSTATSSYAYDAEGRRVERTLDGQVTRFVYDGAQAVREVPNTGSAVDFVNGPGLDQVWARLQGASATTLVTDALASTVAEGDALGAVSLTRIYEPFGRSAENGASVENSLQFTGREKDRDELYYYRARYYQPAIGRFTSEDPAGFVDGLNTYSYAKGGPVDGRDPTGMYVTNNSTCTIWYKPESAGNLALPLPCGESSYWHDGVAVPESHQGQVFKNSTGVNVSVGPGGTVQAWYFFGTELFLRRYQDRDGGWKGQDWLAERHSMPVPDNDWNQLFEASQKRPDCKCEH